MTTKKRIRKVDPRATKVLKEVVVGEKIDLEMYDRLVAIAQLRDNFGMKQEPRVNTYEETRRQEVEKSVLAIMEAENCDKVTAATRLLEAMPEDSPLIPVISRMTH